MEPHPNPVTEMVVYPDYLLKEKIIELVDQLNGFTYAELKKFLNDNRGMDNQFPLFANRPD